MDIFAVPSNPMEAVPGYLSSAHNGTVSTENGATAGSAGAPAAGGDTVNFSPEALQLSASSGIAPLAAPTSSMTAAKATSTILSSSMNEDTVTVTSTGVVTWNGIKLDLNNLEGFTNAANLIIQRDDSNDCFNVFNAANPTVGGVKLGSNGKQVAEPLTDLPTGYNNASGSLTIVRSGNFAHDLHGPDGMVVNIAANTDANISAGSGSATLFNFAASVGAITASTGTWVASGVEKPEDSGNIFTVGLTSGTINVGAASTGAVNATLTVISNMTGGAIYTNGNVIIDAEKCALNKVIIDADYTSGSATTIKAKTITNNSKITLGNGLNFVTVSGNMTNTIVNGGANNDIVSIGGKSVNNAFHLKSGDDSLTAKSGNGVTYTSGAGNDTVRFYGAVSNSDFDLGAGVNTFTAANSKDKPQNLTGVTIKADGAVANGDYTTVTAGVLKSSKTKASSIELLGDGENVVKLKSIAGNKKYGVTIELGLISLTSATQTLTVGGGAKFLTFASGVGSDMLTFLGSISNSFFDLGDGNNTLKAENKGKGQALTNVEIKAGDGVSGGGTTITAGAAKGLNYFGGAGNDVIKLSGAVRNSSFALGDGNNTFEAVKKNKQGQDKGQALTNVGITGGAGSSEITFGRLLSGGKNAPDMGPWSGNITINLKV